MPQSHSKEKHSVEQKRTTQINAGAVQAGTPRTRAVRPCWVKAAFPATGRGYQFTNSTGGRVGPAAEEREASFTRDADAPLPRRPTSRQDCVYRDDSDFLSRQTRRHRASAQPGYLSGALELTVPTAGDTQPSQSFWLRNGLKRRWPTCRSPESLPPLHTANSWSHRHNVLGRLKV